MNNLLSYNPYVFNTSITWYAVFILFGAIIAYVLCKYFYKKSEKYKEYPSLIDDLFILVFPAGIIGARIWFVFSELSYYSQNFWSIFKIWEGGLAIQGGVMGGILAGYIFYKVKKVKLSFAELADIVVPNILIAQAIGRWGNFFNQEVYGNCIDRSKLNFIPNFILNNMEVCGVTNQVAQPLFLYESLLNLLGFILISVIIRKFFKKRKNGELVAFYLIWYGLVRMIMEPFRSEEFIMKIGNSSMSVITSILFVVVGVLIILYLWLYPLIKAKINSKKGENKNE